MCLFPFSNIYEVYVSNSASLILAIANGWGSDNKEGFDNVIYARIL